MHCRNNDIHCTEIIIYTSMHVLLTHIIHTLFYKHELKHSNDVITPVRVAFVVSLQSLLDQGRISPHQTSSTNPQIHPKMYNKLTVTSYILQCKYDYAHNCTSNQCFVTEILRFATGTAVVTTTVTYTYNYCNNQCNKPY